MKYICLGYIEDKYFAGLTTATSRNTDRPHPLIDG
jgi:hypothetical protein